MLGSPQDIALLAGLALLLFGPKKLPELGRALGQGLGNFKKALSEVQNEFKEGMSGEKKPPALNDETSAQEKPPVIEEEKKIS